MTKLGFEFGRPLPTAEELVTNMPLSERLIEIKSEKDKELSDIFNGVDDRFVVILGPCSADDVDTVLKYNYLLAALQEEVKNEIFIIPRIYTNKPRTTGKGYKGLEHKPHPLSPPDIVKGIEEVRRLHVKSFSDTNLIAADEMLYPDNYLVLLDVLGYVAVGARSVENQEHRLVASGVTVPVGMKNPTSGDLSVMINAVEAAMVPHVFGFSGFDSIRRETKTYGNLLTHCILRGSKDPNGHCSSNYHSDDLWDVLARYEKNGKIGSPRIIVDTNHDNSAKMYKRQPDIAMEVLFNMSRHKDIKNAIKGIMVEGYFSDGSQIVNNGDPYILGRSITDPCLGLDKTQRMIREVTNYFAKIK